MTDDQYRVRIEKELTVAYESFRVGQEGRTRVCARRAAGEAIAWYVEKYGCSGWGRDVISRLTRLKNETSFPEEIRSAANRLSARITDRFSYPSPYNPIEDAKIIIEYFRELIRRGNVL
jgi:HEPN domain-containing protein